MEIVDSYFTLESLSEGLYKEKGSKFISYAVACYSEEEAKIQLAEWKKMHHQARHVCYAYRFGLDKKIFRANDDGEPMNSAGTPILGQIQSHDLTNVLIGVIRYFGGTKLGVGGLVQAYKTAAKEAIEQGTIIEKKVFEHINLHFSYNEMPEVMNLVKNNQIIVEKQNFDIDCTLQLALSLEKSMFIISQFEANKQIKIHNLGIY